MKTPPAIGLFDLPTVVETTPRNNGTRFTGIPHQTLAKTIDCLIRSRPNVQPIYARGADCTKHFYLFADGVGMVGYWPGVQGFFGPGTEADIAIVAANDRHTRPSIFWGESGRKFHHASRSEMALTDPQRACEHFANQICDTHAEYVRTRSAAMCSQKETALLLEAPQPSKTIDYLLAEACRRKIVPWSAVGKFVGWPSASCSGNCAETATRGELLAFLRAAIEFTPIQTRPNAGFEAWRLLSG